MLGIRKGHLGERNTNRVAVFGLFAYVASNEIKVVAHAKCRFIGHVEHRLLAANLGFGNAMGGGKVVF